MTCTVEGNNSVGSLLEPLLKVTRVVGSRMLCCLSIEILLISEGIFIVTSMDLVALKGMDGHSTWVRHSHCDSSSPFIQKT
jgi:hypothetical protein